MYFCILFCTSEVHVYAYAIQHQNMRVAMFWCKCMSQKMLLNNMVLVIHVWIKFYYHYGGVVCSRWHCRLVYLAEDWKLLLNMIRAKVEAMPPHPSLLSQYSGMNATRDTFVFGLFNLCTLFFCCCFWLLLSAIKLIKIQCQMFQSTTDEGSWIAIPKHLGLLFSWTL